DIGLQAGIAAIDENAGSGDPTVLLGQQWGSNQQQDQGSAAHGTGQISQIHAKIPKNVGILQILPPPRGNTAKNPYNAAPRCEPEQTLLPAIKIAANRLNSRVFEGT